MTQKDIIKIAESADIMDALMEMRNIQQNMIYKTAYEKKRATRRLKELAREIVAELKE